MVDDDEFRGLADLPVMRRRTISAMSGQCQHHIQYLDPVLRYTGRTKNGFERQWTWRLCKHEAVYGELCAIHFKKFLVEQLLKGNETK